MSFVNYLTRMWFFLRKPLVSLVLRLTISGLLLAYLFRMSAFEQIAQAFSRIELIYLLFFFLLYFTSISIQVLRWKYLLNAWNVQLEYSVLFRWIMTGLFLNNFLPGSLGGDSFRLLSGTKQTGKVDVIAATIFYERVLGYGSLIIMGLVALTVRNTYSQDWLFGLLLGGMFLALLGLTLIVYFPFVRRTLDRMIKRYPVTKKLQLDNWLKSFRFKVKHPGILAGIFVISFLIQTMDIFSFRLVATALQIPVRLSDLFLFIPLLYLAIMLPLSVNGIGIRETVFVIFSSLWGISSADAVAFSLTVFALSLAGSLVGGPLYWMDRARLGGSKVKKDSLNQDKVHEESL